MAQARTDAMALLTVDEAVGIRARSFINCPIAICPIEMTR